MNETRERQIRDELAQMDAEHERLQALSRPPDPDGGPEAVAARQERRMRRMRMGTGQVERLVPGRPAG